MAPATRITYTVAFSSASPLLFLTDQNGSPVSEVELTPGSGRGQPATVFIRQRSSYWLPFQRLRLNITVLDPTQTDRKLSEGIDFPLAAWSRLPLFWLRFLDTLFGPALTLASTAVIVVGFGMQQILQRQDREEEEGIKQKRMEIERLGELVKTDPGKAVRLWSDYSQWVSPVEGKSEWQKPELQEKLTGLWDKEIADQPWRKALLTEAVGLFNSGDQEKAVVRAKLIHSLDPKGKSVETIAAGCLVACAEDKRQQITNIASQVGPKQVMEAIWKFYTSHAGGELADPAKLIAVQTLAELAGQPTAIAEVHQVLIKDEVGLRLLREPEFGDVLQRLSTEASDSQHRQLAADLKAKRVEAYRWPPLWPNWLQNSPGDQTGTLKWLKEVISDDFKYDPFIPLKAEFDPHFERHFVYPLVLEAKTGPQRSPLPTILFGGPGSGKTAAALIIAGDCRNAREGPQGNSVFPLYLPLPLARGQKADTMFYLDFIVRATARSLVDFLALNPYTFLEHKENQKFALAHLLTYNAESVQNLGILLKQTELSNNSAGRHFLKRLIDHSQVIPETPTYNQESLLEMLRYARPYGFSSTYVLIDVAPVSESLLGARGAAKLQPLLDLMLSLAGRDVYLKLFVPLALKKELEVPHGVVTEILHWTDEALDQMLKKRLEGAESRIDSFDAFFDRNTRLDLNPTPTLIRKAGGSPGQLIHLVHQLIRHQLDKEIFARIDHDSLEKVLDLPKDGPMNE